MLGPAKFQNQLLAQQVFQVGQWQGGVFQGVAPAGIAGVKPALIPKPAWKN